MSAVEVRYQNSFGVRAGYLPRDRSVLDQWHAELVESIPDDPSNAAIVHRSVQQFAELLDRDPIVRMYVTQMVVQAAELPEQPQRRWTVTTVAELIAALDQIVAMAPTYRKLAFPMSALFAYMMMTAAGEAVFRMPAMNAALRLMLREWCAFLNSPQSQSVLTTAPGGWLSPEAEQQLRLDDFVVDKADPHWGFKSWNDFFHRQIKLDLRPVSYPGDPRIVVSANDGHVYNFASNVQRHDEFWAKAQSYSLGDMLNGKYLERFIHGSRGADVIQSFLSGNDYHRFTSPIDGVVRHVEVVEGLMFSNAEVAGPDPGAGVLSQGYEVSVNTRGLVFIESGPGGPGMVCVIPIGITEVSSVELHVKSGAAVRKGDPLGWFSFGGSTLCMVFEPGAIDHYTLRAPLVNDPNAGPLGSIDSVIKARERIAVVRPR